MSILIKGMKMPTSCTMCWLSPICHVWVKEVSRYKGYDNRLPNCPLVEVPPHGRLIDADELLKWADVIPLTWDGGVDINDLEKYLDNAPVIIEAEEE